VVIALDLGLSLFSIFDSTYYLLHVFKLNGRQKEQRQKTEHIQQTVNTKFEVDPHAPTSSGPEGGTPVGQVIGEQD